MSEQPVVAEPQRRFSIVSAVYNVGRYLPEFIASIEAQAFDLDQVEVIAVDDGSTDDSLSLLRAWQARRPDLVRVFTKENGGQGSARNLGLEHVRGQWVTFPDPDDILEPDYLARVAWAIKKQPALVMVATNRLLYFEDIPEIAERHPLRDHFRRDQFVNLDKLPEFFHGSAPAAFFRSAEIVRHQLRFDERIRPNFEDGHFCQRYLLRTGEPLVAFLKTAHYLYRKRSDQTSTLQTGLMQPGRYTTVPRLGYLGLLKEAAALRGGRAPRWLQNMIVYELSWFVSTEDNSWNAGTACHGAVAEEFLTLMRDIRRELDDDVIREFSVRRLGHVWRQILLKGISDEAWHTPYVVVQRYDEDRKQVLLCFRYTGDEPKVELLHRGNAIDPISTKIRAHVYWDHIILRERMMWVPANGALRVLLDGRAVEPLADWSERRVTALRPGAIRRQFGLAAPEAAPAVNEVSALQAVADRSLIRLAASPPVRRRFADAWVLMDRMEDSADSGELLFRHLRSKNRDINAWFVVTPDSPDFARLRKDGFRRVVGYGTLRWKLLMLNCKHLISSHADGAVLHPTALRTLIPSPTWKFTFLQHGVIKDDIASYLNPKKIDLMVTSTPAEHESIVGDDSRYVLTRKEVRRTGLPRFDRLRVLGHQVTEASQTLILIAPTWRSWLAKPPQPGVYRRDLVDDFLSTDYAENWVGLLRSESLARVCREQGLRMGFLPHPNMQASLKRLSPLPPHVDALTYADNDVQELFAKAAVTVTDYSSLVFNSAYINRPVVYFQFDRERVERGGYGQRTGYFDYERDGFGAVTQSLPDAERAIEETLARGRRSQPPYDARITDTFPDRDGKCCKRVTAAIRAL